MKLYKLLLTTDGGISAGAKWFTSKTAAKAAANDHHRNIDPDAPAPDIETVNVSMTKAGILSLLFHHGSHPDNG